jgi:hypothetical protein
MPAEVIGSVVVLQVLKGLSDREAISALRRDIAWKVAFGLRLDDEQAEAVALLALVAGQDVEPGQQPGS